MKEILNELKNETLCIAPESIKKKILREINKTNELYPVKFITLNEFQKHYFFDYHKNAISCCMKKYSLKYSIVQEYLNNLYYVTDEDYGKIRKLRQIKQDLEENNLLVYDEYFKKSLTNKNILVIGYNLDPFYQKIMNKLNAKILHEENIEPKEITVFEANNIDDEILFVGNKIIELNKSGVSLSDICILDLPKEYKNPILRIFSSLNIPIEIQSKTALLETPIASFVLNKLKETKNYSTTIQETKEKFSRFPKEIQQIITIFNNNPWEDSKEFLVILEKEFEKTYIQRPILKNKIQIKNLDEIEEGKYYFLMGFNKENIPVIYKDEDIFNDSEKEKIGLFTSEQKNKYEKEKIKNILFSTPNLTITYKLKTAFDSYNPSLLIEECDTKIEKIKEEYAHSNSYNQILLAKSLDKLNKYGIHENNLDILYKTYPNISYQTYDNQFKGISKTSLYEYLNQKLLLSYSSIDNFYKCSFRYYLNNILKVDKFHDTLMTNIGTIFHNVLMSYNNSDFDFDLCFEQEVSNYEFTLDEKTLISKLKDELRFDIETLKKQKNITDFTKELHEEKLFLDLYQDQNIKTTFMGIIDKIMYLEENGKTYMSIIDYKTGTLPDNLNNTIYGIGMQLPVYLYLIQKTKKFENAEVVGIYLQRIINKELKREIGKDYLANKENNLKLVGYSLEDEELLERFDYTYKDSNLIKGMKVGNNGFYKYSKVLSKEKLNKLSNLVENKINDATISILNADFQINPKQIGKELVGCQYCKYKDICFYQEKDIKRLKEYKNLDFLGDDSNA